MKEKTAENSSISKEMFSFNRPDSIAKIFTHIHLVNATV